MRKIEVTEIIDGNQTVFEHRYSSNEPLLTKYDKVSVMFPAKIKDGRWIDKRKFEKNHHDRVDDSMANLLLMAMGFK